MCGANTPAMIAATARSSLGRAKPNPSPSQKMPKGPNGTQPQVKVLPRQGEKDWLERVEYLRVAAAEECQSPLLRGKRTVGNGDIDNLDSSCSANPMERSR